MAKPIYLYIAPFFPSEKHWRGGFFLDAVKALKADGRYEVVVMTSARWLGEYEIEGIKVHKIPRRHIGSAEYFESLLVPRNNRLFISKLKDMGIAPEDVAVCHVHDFIHYVQYALEVKRLNANCLTLVHHHYAGYYDLRIGKLGVFPVWSHLLYLKLRKEFESVDAHVFISEHCRGCYGHDVDFDTGEDKGELRKRLSAGSFLLPKIELPDSYVWYNGVDLVKFNTVTDKPSNHPFTVGCIGNFNPCKCQLDLVKAFEIVLRTIPDAKLKLVGEGRMHSQCEEYVASHNMSNSVEFLKSMPHDELPDFYRGLDLFVMPSVNEGFCCVNAEANYCGTPAVAIKGMPIEEILSEEDRERWLVPPHDIVGLARKMVEFSTVRFEQRFTVDLDSNFLAKKFVDWTIGKREVLKAHGGVVNA